MKAFSDAKNRVFIQVFNRARKRILRDFDEISALQNSPKLSQFFKRTYNRFHGTVQNELEYFFPDIPINPETEETAFFYIYSMNTPLLLQRGWDTVSVFAYFVKGIVQSLFIGELKSGDVYTVIPEEGMYKNQIQRVRNAGVNFNNLWAVYGTIPQKIPSIKILSTGDMWLDIIKLTTGQLDVVWVNVPLPSLEKKLVWQCVMETGINPLQKGDTYILCADSYIKKISQYA